MTHANVVLYQLVEPHNPRTHCLALVDKYEPEQKIATDTAPEIAKPLASTTEIAGLFIAINGNINTAINKMVANRFHLGSVNK